MATTTNGIRYPLSSDHKRLWEHYQNMAEDVDDLLGGAIYASRTSNLTLTGSYQTVATLASLTADGVIPWRLEITWWGVNPSGAAPPILFTCAIRESSTAISEIRNVGANSASTAGGGTRSHIFVPTAGAHTYNFAIKNDSAGSPVLEASSTSAAQISAIPWRA